MSVFTDTASVNGIATIAGVSVVDVIGGTSVNGVSTITAGYLKKCVGVASVNGVATIVKAVSVALVIAVASVNSVANETAAATIRFTGKASINGVATISATGHTLVNGRASANGISTETASYLYKVGGKASVNSVATYVAKGSSGIIGLGAINGVATITAKSKAIKNFTASVNAVATESSAPLTKATGKSVVNAVATISAIGRAIARGAASVNGVATYFASNKSLSDKTNVNGIATYVANARIKVVGVGNVSGIASWSGPIPIVRDKFGVAIAAPTWYDKYWSALVKVLGTAWPEAIDKIAQDNQIERLDWVNALNAGQLTPPWVVVSLSIQPTDLWGPGPKYAVVASVYYIVDTLKAKNAQTTIGTASTAASMITDKLIALQHSMEDDITMGLVNLDDMPIDNSASNPINVSLINAKQTLQAGSIQVTTIVYGI